jgi:hypothetical protein
MIQTTIDAIKSISVLLPVPRKPHLYQDLTHTTLSITARPVPLRRAAAPSCDTLMSCQGFKTGYQRLTPRFPGAGLTHGRGLDILRRNHQSPLARSTSHGDV